MTAPANPVPPGRPSPRLQAFVGLVTFAVTTLATAPTPYLLDSAELASASFTLGIAHPPGETFALLWGRLFCCLPFGSVAFRVGLGQGVACAGAAVLVLHLAGALFSALGGDKPHPWLSVVAALGFGLGPGLVGNSARPEVYALQVLLSLGALLAAVRATRGNDPRGLLVAAFLLGLGVANHPLVAFVSSFGVFVLALPMIFGGSFARLRLFFWFVLAGILGLGVLAYLPLRAAAVFADPARAADMVAWGDGRTIPGLLWILAARTFTAKSTIVHGNASPASLPFVLIAELGFVLAILLPLGLFIALRDPRSRRLAVALGLTMIGAFVGALMAGFDPENPDVRGYLAPGLATAAVFAVIPVVVVGRQYGLRFARIFSFSVAGLFLIIVVQRPPLDLQNNLRTRAIPDAVTASLLYGLPPRALLLSSHFETAFLLSYQRAVEGRRPDVAWAHLGFAGGPGYADRLAAAHPDLAPLVFAQRDTAFTSGILATSRRPVRLEPDLHLGSDVLSRLVPDGGLWRLALATDSPATVGVPTALDEGARDEALRDRSVRGFLAWRALNDAKVACERGLTAWTASRIGDLLTLVPEDRVALELAARCRR